MNTPAAQPNSAVESPTLGDKSPRFVGSPTGPKKFVAELGCEVGTFTQKPTGIKFEVLMHHVPPLMRGDYRPKDLANYSAKSKYRTDKTGRVLCGGMTKAEKRCTHRAINMAGRCGFHGGQLHPLDKFIVQDVKDPESEELSRYQQFLVGQITVEDLDDEELAMCGFRTKSDKIYQPKNVPRAVVDEFIRATFERATSQMRSSLHRATKVLADIMDDKNNDPEIRFKAAKEIIERNMGKATQTINVTTDAPWEEIFTQIAGGSRDESRKARGYIDAEVVGGEQLSISTSENGGVPDEITSASEGFDDFLQRSSSVAAITERIGELPDGNSPTERKSTGQQSNDSTGVGANFVADQGNSQRAYRMVKVGQFLKPTLSTPEQIEVSADDF